MGIIKREGDRKRDDVRIRIREGIRASLSITGVNGNDVETRHIPVILKDISPSGMQFLTHLRFPVSPDYTVGVMIVLGEWQFRLAGNIVWRRMEENQYVYGCFFQPDRHMRAALLRAISWKLADDNPRQEWIHELYHRLQEKPENIGIRMDLRS
ncbi:PilZ domain-containing protein [Paenibacillus sp. sptzw28]|uniref:PilZ domain-containing protein n=1 Tax=Paenibacillus sp. sptzw28 TaxID=715179 RepID=UPI001C6EA448|nr:PilZ domain-containing protein [Paenibacillus sp. sptzw28]QYR20600.1 PilZ domain-containing protein [Paenibacillus sp. sptzw28]